MASDPPILTYDGHSPARDRRSHGVIAGYCAGVQAASLVYAAVSYVAATRNHYDPLPRFLSGIVFPIGFAFVSLLPQIIFLGTTLWLKRKLFKEVRFGGLRAAILWGFFGGLFPWPLLPLLQDSGIDTTLFLFAALGWFAIFPMVAGTFLCYRSHLRD